VTRVRSSAANTLTVYSTGTPPMPVSFVNASRKLRRAETIQDPLRLRPMGPSRQGESEGEGRDSRTVT
jgi:hypothetical protein